LWMEWDASVGGVDVVFFVRWLIRALLAPREGYLCLALGFPGGPFKWIITR
jgi:hypothetical protein